MPGKSQHQHLALPQLRQPDRLSSGGQQLDIRRKIIEF